MGVDELDRSRLDRLLPAALVAVLVAYVATALEAPDTALVSWVRDLVLGNLVCVLSIATLVHRAHTRPAERSSCLLLAGATFSFMVGAYLFLAQQTGTEASQLPSVTYVVSLATYPLLLTGVLLALGPHIRRVRLIVALDGLAGALAGASVAAAAVAPVVARAYDGSGSAAVSLGFVVAGVVLVSASLGALAVVGPANGRHFALWTVGTAMFSVGDLAYAFLRASDAYRAGTWVDCCWVGGMALMALGATAVRSVEPQLVPPLRSLAVVITSCVAAVCVLTVRVAPAWGPGSLPSVLALLALAAGGVRFALAFAQLRELAVVRQQALTDELTGAGNRRALYGRLDELFARTGAGSTAEPQPFALAVIDLNHFKEVNDSHGHAAGDELLRAVAARLQRGLDQLQMPGLLARLGGDEFAIVLADAHSEADARIFGDALQQALRDPVVLDEGVLHVQASIGVALAPLHGQTRSDILFAADAAMYAAKTTGEPVCLFSAEQVGDRRRRLEIAEDLYAALERRELTLEYQPVLTPRGELEGMEALVRWDHPTRGRLSPEEFLEVAERYRLTPSIAVRVLDLALSDLRRWRQTRPGLRMAVNVSASDLRDEALVDTVASALLRHDVPPTSLTIEITETAMMRDPKMARTVMQALSELGVQLAVDDYGTGYSSLEYLLRLPIHALKLDRAFSADLANQRRSVEIVRSTVGLTHALGLRMIAEGVEDEATLTILRELGCDLVQGYHLGRPMPPVELERFLARTPARRETPAGSAGWAALRSRGPGRR
ncbi:MAG TPA: bifunctional diguanylate cyclase/phosphodiesterase [Nocardioidaceae bacterium]|nr:bifunctional diguanylate cyclase/phosphodiesterase [Nocardioidaceae bacterium]